jgi:2-aminoadipate transaminase
MNYDAFLSRAAEKMQQSAIRQMGTVAAQVPDIISFAPGYPSPEAFAWDAYREIAADLLGGRDGGVLQYGPTRGYKPLLEALVGLLDRRGIAATPGELLVTTGSQQGLDLAARVILDPGDVVLLELPSYTGALTAFRNVQASLVGVRQQPDGIDLDDLEAVTARLAREGRRVKALYVVPNFQNPTGLLIGRPKRRALLEWAARHDTLVIEDDPYGELAFDDAVTAADTRPVKADDAAGRVIYLSSFSKTLAPAFRSAWMVAPAPLAAKFEVAKQAIDLCTGGFDQRLVYEACRRGVLDRQIPMLRDLYRRRRDAMETALESATGIGARWVTPRGGFFLWVTLPDEIDTTRLLPEAMRRGVIYVAGPAFFVDGTGHQTMRLAFSAATPERIGEGIGRLAAAITERRATAGPAPAQVAPTPAAP